MSIAKYNAIAVELFPKDKENKVNVKRYILTDDLEYLEELEKKDNFIIISPISYAGRKRTAENARFIYAMAIDLDGMTKEQNIILAMLKDYGISARSRKKLLRNDSDENPDSPLSQFLDMVNNE